MLHSVADIDTLKNISMAPNHRYLPLKSEAYIMTTKLCNASIVFWYIVPYKLNSSSRWIFLFRGIRYLYRDRENLTSILQASSSNSSLNFNENYFQYPINKKRVLVPQMAGHATGRFINQSLSGLWVYLRVRSRIGDFFYVYISSWKNGRLRNLFGSTHVDFIWLMCIVSSTFVSHLPSTIVVTPVWVHTEMTAASYITFGGTLSTVYECFSWYPQNKTPY